MLLRAVISSIPICCGAVSLNASRTRDNDSFPEQLLIFINHLSEHVSSAVFALHCLCVNPMQEQQICINNGHDHYLHLQRYTKRQNRDTK